LILKERFGEDASFSGDIPEASKTPDGVII
jgi:hypothetical protein